MNSSAITTQFWKSDERVQRRNTTSEKEQSKHQMRIKYKRDWEKRDKKRKKELQCFLNLNKGILLQSSGDKFRPLKKGSKRIDLRSYSEVEEMVEHVSIVSEDNKQSSNIND